MPVYKDGAFFGSWQDVSFSAQVDYNQSREPLGPSEANNATVSRSRMRRYHGGIICEHGS